MNSAELRENIAREVCDALSPSYSTGGTGRAGSAWESIRDDELASRVYYAAADRIMPHIAAALERLEALDDLSATVVAWMGEHECPHCRAGFVDVHNDDACPFAHLELYRLMTAATPAPAGQQGGSDV